MQHHLLIHFPNMSHAFSVTIKAHFASEGIMKSIINFLNCFEEIGRSRFQPDSEVQNQDIVPHPSPLRGAFLFSLVGCAPVLPLAPARSARGLRTIFGFIIL